MMFGPPLLTIMFWSAILELEQEYIYPVYGLRLDG